MKTRFLYLRVFLGNLFRHLFSKLRGRSGRGAFIVIDGGEGSGKGTVIERLKARFPDMAFSREPGGTPYAEECRRVMLDSPEAKGASGRTQLLLVNAGRSDHMERNAEHAILAGKDFLTDRSDSTTWSYQIAGQEGGYELMKLYLAVRKAVYDKVEPDLYIILEVDPEEGARRVAARKGEVNHFDSRKRDFHERVMAGFRTFGKLFPFKVSFVDANRTRDEVYADVERIVERAISKR